MSRIDLLPNEAIILRDSEMKHDRGGMFDSELDELILTNQALIVVHKSIFGRAKDTQRFPLDQITIANGAPRVIIGMSQDDERQLHVYFRHGIEAFTLGNSDEDAEAGIIETLFASTKDQENRNLRQWQVAISQAVMALPRKTHTGNPQIRRVPAAAQGGAPTVKASAPPVVHATKKCIGCMAPLSGVQGQKVTCRYCDIEQAL